MVQLGKCAAAVLALGWALSASAAAAAPPARVLWSSYLRAGPGQAFEAITELEHDTRVEVAGCAGGWCRVSDGGAWGYVDRDALTLPRPSPGSPAAAKDCVSVPQADEHGRGGTRFCPAPAPGG